MKRTYTKALMSIVLVSGITAASFAQGQKVKTVTIVNGDTTISETNLNEKEIAKLEKDINVTMSGDEKGTKKIVKKIVITDDKEGGDGMAYAYATGDDLEDVEVTTENGETKVVIKRNEGKEANGEKKIVKKETVKVGAVKEKNNMQVKIRVEKTMAKLEVETSNKEPLNISILDENGKQVFYDTQQNGGKYTKEIPLGKKGTYFLNLIQNKTSTMEKIIVE